MYAILLRIFRPLTGDFVHAGRLISILAAGITVLPVYLLARRVFGDRAGLFAAALYTASPTVNRWAIRMMNDPITVLFFTTSSYFVISAVGSLIGRREPRREPSRREVSEGRAVKAEGGDSVGRDLLLAFLTGGLAAASRYQGAVLLPPLLLVEGWWIRSRRPAWTHALLHGLLGFSIFGAVAAWLFARGLRGWFQLPGADRTLRESASLIAGNIGAYLWHLPYVLTPFVFLALAIGLLRSSRSADRTTSRKGTSSPEPGRPAIEKWFYLLFGFVTVEILVIHGIYQAFQTRYLLPVLPYVFAVAGHGIASLSGRRPLPAVALGLAVATSLAMSGAVLVLQRDTFGDVRRTAEYLAKTPETGAIYSDEIYKMNAFSGKRILPYDPRRSFRAGDRIAFHSLYVNLPAEAQRLSSSYALHVEMETASRITPLLPDIIAEAPVTNRPEWEKYRFREQVFHGAVVRIDGPRVTP